jgi:hypothetical protein
MEFVLGPGGRRVWVSWSDHLLLEDVSSILFGPVLTCLAMLRGKTCLHGSVIALADRALAILGASGAGKSTLALACIRRGARLVSDDLVLLEEVPAGFAARCGSPALRLRPQTAEALWGSFESLRPIWSSPRAARYKRYLDLAGNDAGGQSAVPLAAIIVLGSRLPGAETASFEPLPPAPALATLMAHRPADFLSDREGHVRDFALLSRLASRIPINRLCWPDGFEGLDLLSERVLTECCPRA